MRDRRLAAAVAASCLLGFATMLAAKSPLDVRDASQRPRLRTIYSSDVDLQQLAKQNKNGLVLIFLGTECPVARLYVPTLTELHQQFQNQGIQFLGVYSDVGVNVQDMAIHAHDEDIPFPVLQDVEHRLADLLQVQVTPEVVVLDARLEKRYQGAIDNQYQRHGRKPAPTRRYLQDALTSLVSGQPVEVTSAPASGCPLERRTLAHSTRELSYHKDVAPLVQQHCQGCHRPGGPGPFELLTFDDVAGNSEKIREVVTDRRMPPWHGFLDPQFGKLRNDQRLPDEALATMVDWIDGGAAEGNRSDAPPPRQWPAAGEWAIGKPDFVYRMPQPFMVPRSGTLEYQFFRVPMDLPEDRWFRGVEIKPGSPEVVHHVALHIAPATKPQRNEGLALMAQLYGINGEKAHLINDFVPGDTYNAKVYPPDQAVLIPKHSDLIFELHYTPNGRAQSDQSMVAFQWADAPPQDEVLTTVFRKAIGRFRIPPHESHYPVEDTYHFAHDVEIDAIRPHFHLRGKSFRLEMVERDPQTDEITKRRTILTVPIFDQAWQRTYELATPLFLPAGTELIATGHYDNSDFNPNNPDPSAEVTWGQQTTDEMFSTRFKYRVAKPSVAGGEG